MGWISAYFVGRKFITGLLASRSVIKTLDNGACSSTCKFFASLGLNGLSYIKDYRLLFELASLGIAMVNAQY